MRVRLAKTAGFCMGVREAMETALGLIHRVKGPLYTFGPLIHNPQVLQLLEDKGVIRLNEIPAAAEGTVIIRAHGVPPQQEEALRRAGLNVVDATCPWVKSVQRLSRMYAGRGHLVVIVGDADHPEVVGLLGYAGERGRVVSGPEEVAALPEAEKVAAVAQTTQRPEVFKAVVKALEKRYGEIQHGRKAICDATQNRQAEVKRLAGAVDALVVVGGFDSGNTKRLAEVGRAAGVRSWHVETEADLDWAALTECDTVGVTSGASTPNWMIRKVVRELETRRGRGESFGRVVAERVIRFLLRSHLMVALGAASLSVATCLLQGLRPSLGLMGVAFFYIHSMHILNQFLDKEAGEYNDPDRAKFLVRHRWLLIGAGIVSAFMSLFLGWLMGRWVFILLVAISAAGVLYSVPLVSIKVGRWRIRRLKDVPGSKSMSAALAWGAITALVPALSAPGLVNWLVTAFVFVAVTLLIYIRSGLFDIFDVQGDRIVGQETIPILLGEPRTRRLLWLLTGVLGLVLAMGPLVLPEPGLSWWLLLCVGYAAGYLYVYQKRWLHPG
ncbi:MAG: 4-hydroxy-3-methylbut-2-enyl diphosphate reductase, partial [Proteobacteria bacterium]|nr:4-hydroxy-3-methylbut-2-enyl diphosphate reductase [Pseudomonadota bacterium]